MKKIFALSFAVLIFTACALEKEETSYTYGVFNYTVGKVNINSIDGKTIPAPPSEICVNINNTEDILMNVTIVSEGKYSDISHDIETSRLDIDRIRIYYGDGNALYYDVMDKGALNSVVYNGSVTDNITMMNDAVISAMNIPDNEAVGYNVAIEILATERSDTYGMTNSNSFSSSFGAVKFASSREACGETAE